MSTNNFIVADWGSSNIRFFLYLNNQLVDSKKSDQGITKVQGQDCAKVFKEACGSWLEQHGSLPCVLAGMVGSINGWIDAPYLECPVNLDKLPEHLCTIDNDFNTQIKVVPGLCIKNTDNYNVMRGEETQLVGALKIKPLPYYLMPGTHCKWVKINNNVVESFRTVMTGELHNLLLNKSLVGMGAGPQEACPQVFAEALEQGFNHNDLLPHLFEVRGARLVGNLNPAHVQEYLSGLLIGSEVASMIKIFNAPQGSTVGLIGNDSLNQRYKQALNLANLNAVEINGDQAFIEGIVPLAQSLS